MKYLKYFYLNITIFILNANEINLMSLKGIGAGCEMIGKGISQALKKNFKVNYLKSRENNESFNYKSKTLYADMLWYVDKDLYKFCPDTYIKIAYSMFEGSVLPKEWVNAINNYFDAVVVPDDYLIKIYENSGVIKPIFVIPMPIFDLNCFEKNACRQKVFTFGIVGGLDDRKCIEESITAFINTFGNNKEYELRIHAYWASSSNYYNNIILLINNYNNISFTYGVLPRDVSRKIYNEIDCLLSCSAGEGFSITPREALKSGIPVICLNYGVQKNICNSGYVYSINPNKIKPCFIDSYGGYCGEIEYADFSVISDAMVNLVNNYDYYKKLAEASNEWLKMFDIKYAGNKFNNLLNPECIIFGNENKILDNGFMTNNNELLVKFKKYNYSDIN